MDFRRPAPRLAILALAACAFAACGGPRTDRIAEKNFKRRPRLYPIETYVGSVTQSHQAIAVIESDAYATDDDATKERQIEQLKKKARSVGADAVHEVRLLTKEIKGFSPDERVPFPAWKQGEYPLYFMRGEAIIYESGLPGAVSRGQGFTAGPEGYVPPSEPAEKPQNP